ncbi:hypothetical protein [Methanolobus sp.]|uniref:hypothetical protein n=1 Tax=Methanolobus sp. TaxID=1874737 RepID=UPI0025F8ABE7|nr:hypothetical protein [Methanolobus sp.]
MSKIYDTHKERSYKCHNCGYSREVTIPCNNCGDMDVCCPFCGEVMMKTWQGYNE